MLQFDTWHISVRRYLPKSFTVKNAVRFLAHPVYYRL